MIRSRFEKENMQSVSVRLSCCAAVQPAKDGVAEDVYINIAPSLDTREERLPSLELIVIKPKHVNGVALKASRVHKMAL
jgi:hypothetical protein